MKMAGQLSLVFISVAFTAYQSLVHQKPFFTLDFFIFTVIAWFVGWQYDKLRCLEKRARENEESYKTLIHSIPEAVLIHKEGIILFANAAAAATFGVETYGQMLGKSIFNYIDPAYNWRFQARLSQVQKTNRPLTNTEYRIMKEDGSKIVFEASSLNISFGGGNAVLTIGKDITSKKEETERFILKSEKLALLGQMAAGIAHEIRNPLTSIKGFVQLFRADTVNDQYYDIVLSELDRINQIVGEFLVLSKPSAVAFEENDMRRLLADVVTLIHSESALNNVRINLVTEPVSMVSCEAAQIKQVMLNLLKNSMEAMPDGGEIVVSLSQKDDSNIQITIKDEGVGIPVERIPTLGEPFYTTKEKGTGLGLMTCFKIVESHKGRLTIASQVQKGTTVEIVLPTISQPCFVNYSFFMNSPGDLSLINTPSGSQPD